MRKQSYQQRSMGCHFIWLTVCLLLIVLSDAFVCLPGFKEQVEKFLVEKPTEDFTCKKMSFGLGSPRAANYGMWGSIPKNC